jgi:hypothetical protein
MCVQVSLHVQYVQCAYRSAYKYSMYIVRTCQPTRTVCQPSCLYRTAAGSSVMSGQLAGEDVRECKCVV